MAKLPSERPKPSMKGSGESDGLTQSERFIKAAQELGTDDDLERFKERVKKIARAPTYKAPPIVPSEDKD